MNTINSKSRALTPEEGRQRFYSTVCSLFLYWRDVPTEKIKTLLLAGEREEHARMEGLLRSLFVVFDGRNMSLPAFDIYPSPHEDDREYCEKDGANWWSDKEPINDVLLSDDFPWHKLRRLYNTRQAWHDEMHEKGLKTHFYTRVWLGFWAGSTAGIVAGSIFWAVFS